MHAINRFARPLALALGVAVVSAPAFAADVIFQEPPAPSAPMQFAPVSTWAGPYAGVSANYGFSSTVRDRSGAGNSISNNGFGGSAFGGFNMQDGAFVYGVEGDVGYQNRRGSNAGVDTRASIDGSLRARAGVAVTEDVLVYGTAGGAAQRLRVTDNTVAPGVNNRDTEVMLGWTAGVGVDARLTDQVFGRVEYRHTRYGARDFNIGGADRSVSSTENRVGLGLGVKF
jgi:outer membrane immunogenic protein